MENEEQRTETTVKTPPPKEKKEEIQLKEIAQHFFSGYGKEGTDETKKIFQETLRKYLDQILNKFESSKQYNILILHDYSSMLKSDADNIYRAIKKFKEKKPILLILLSRGGEAGSAYLIGKLCRGYSDKKFVVSIPRFAKSAATLLSCAADEIHMGDLSELGPIDPQIDGMPALALKNSIEHIATLVTNNPVASEMFAKYLHLSTNPVQIGYYERVAISALQYAENLLETHSDKLPKSSMDIAFELVYKYKDHGFVIDKEEAKKIFGEKIVRENTDEYKIGNEIYEALNFVKTLADLEDYLFYFIGSKESSPTFSKKNN
jgi:hypothetical protein